MIARRSFLRGLVAAPAVVAFGSLMPLRGIVMPINPQLVAEFVAGSSRVKLWLEGQDNGDLHINMVAAHSGRAPASWTPDGNLIIAISEL